MLINSYLRTVASNGLESFKQYYGTYRAIVARNDDPEQRGRIKIRACSPLDLERDQVFMAWIEPATAVAGPNRGFFWPPEVGDYVNVLFDRGRPDTPIKYEHGYVVKGELPEEFAYTEQEDGALAPTRRGMITRGGHALVFSDQKDNQTVELTWRKSEDPEVYSDTKKTADRSESLESKLFFDADGSITLANNKGARVILDATNGNISLLSGPRSPESDLITMDEDGVKIILRNGDSISFTETGLQIISAQNVTVTGKSFTADTSSSFLSKGAREPVIKGRTFNLKDRVKHEQRSIAYQTLIQTIAGLSSSTAPVPGNALAPLGAAFAQILIAEKVFNESRDLYLSRVTQTG